MSSDGLCTSVLWAAIFEQSRTLNRVTRHNQVRHIVALIYPTI